jgi:hypothetical protein
VKSRALVLTVILVTLLECQGRGDTVAHQNPASAASVAVDDTAGCTIDTNRVHPDPSKLVAEFLRRDAAGQFTATNAWDASAFECPGHMPGWDGSTVITAYSLEPLSVGPDTARYTVRYQVFGSLDDDSVGVGLRILPSTELDTFVVVRTPYGWRIALPIIDPHLLPRTAVGFQLKARDRHALDSLAAVR